MPACRQCSSAFEITSEDLAFYDKVSPEFSGKKELISPPTLCAECRSQRRHAFRNERNMFHRKCDFDGKQIIAAYPPGDTVVYHHPDWWSDAWNPLTYGRDFDFLRPFFDQFGELLHATPHMSLALTNAENSDYCHLIGDCKNCYLVFESSHAQDCLHGYWLQKCTDCSDVSFSHECERCYELDNCYQCHSLRWSRNCTNCSDGAFLLDCIGCKDCLFCVNLRQKEYCVFNEQYDRETYEKKLAALRFGSHEAVTDMKKEFDTFALRFPRKYMTAVQDENCTGNYIQESRNCRSCFHAHQAEDCAYGEHVWRDAKDCMDVVTAGRGAQLMYETTNTNMGAARDLFCVQCWSSFDTLYSVECCSCRNCFGCAGMRRNEYCAFNKQYTKGEYERLVPRIIAHMRDTKEWGEFFPPRISTVAYNDSVANEDFPLSREEVLSKGWRWRDDADQKSQYLGSSPLLPDDVTKTGDDVASGIYACESSGKLYKIIPQELKFYRSIGVPLPRRCPDQRHRDRMALRNPRKLWNRQCAKCTTSIQTTYAPERPEIVYCERCYLATVY